MFLSGYPTTRGGTGMGEEKVREHLRQTSEEFRRLEEKHQKYEQQLAEIESHTFLTPEQKREKQTIKKMKLQVKDKMQEIITSLHQSV